MKRAVLVIDIGSTKVCAIIAQIEDNKIDIAGYGLSWSHGIRRGIITNIDMASRSIKKAVDDAKRVSGLNVTTATISISGAYTKSSNSNGIVNIPSNDISIAEINRVMQTALYNANIPNEFEVLHALPFKFKIDEQDFIEDPFGMNASRMEVDVHIVMTQKSNLGNLKKAVHGAGIEIGRAVLSGYASALAVMSPNDKDRGVAVVDMGGQTSNLVIHNGNSIQFNDFLGIGSYHITNDLSLILKTPFKAAEIAKVRKGDLLSNENETIELPTIGQEDKITGVALDDIRHIIFARAEETISLLKQSLENSALMGQINAGVIITGGMVNLVGIRELAQSLMPNIPVRVGKTEDIGGFSDGLSSPEFSTAIGLLRYEAGYHTQYEFDINKKMLHSKEYKPKESLRNVELPQQPVVKQGTLNSSELENNDLFLNLPEHNSSGKKGLFQNFTEWASKIF